MLKISNIATHPKTTTIESNFIIVVTIPLRILSEEGEEDSTKFDKKVIRTSFYVLLSIHVSLFLSKLPNHLSDPFNSIQQKKLK